MSAIVLYESKFGNTERIARAVAEVLKSRGTVRVIPVEEARQLDLKGEELLVLGCPTQGHGMPKAMHDLLETIPKDTLANIPVAAFDTRFNKARWLTGSAAGLGRKVTQHGGHLIVTPESFFVTESQGPLVDGELDRATKWAEGILSKLAA